MRLQEITAEQYLAILQMGGDALCTEDALEEPSREFFLACKTLDKGYGEGCWKLWVSDGSYYKHFYTVVE